MSAADRDLIDRCLAGDQAAWEELVRRYSGLIYSIALKYGLEEADAADVYQQVCLAWWRSLGTVREVEALAGWIATLTGRTAWRLVSDHRRHRGRQVSDPEPVLGTLPAGDLLPEQAVLAAERSNGLYTALEALEERCRYLLTVLFLADEPPDYATLSADLGLAIGSIGSLRQRCLERLRRELCTRVH